MTKRVALFSVVPTAWTEDQVNRQLRKGEEEAKRCQDWYNHHFAEQEPWEWRHFLFKADVYVDPPYYARDWADPWYAEHGDPDWIPDYKMMWGKLSREACGLATVGGDRSAINLMISSCGVGTKVHEQGHNCGRRHSGSIESSGKKTEYGDKSCYLGIGGAVFKGMNGHKMRENSLNHTPLVVVEESCLIRLAPIEQKAGALFPDEVQHLCIKAGSEWVYVTLRKKRGVPWPVPDQYQKEGGLFLHTIDGSTSRWLVPTINPGDLRELPNGVTLLYLDYDPYGEHADIKIEFGGE